MENNFKVGDEVHVQGDSTVMKVNSINGEMVECVIIKNGSIETQSFNYKLLELHTFIDANSLLPHRKTQFD